MSWKRSKDGGMDYDTSVETNYQKAKQKLFGDICASGHTVIFNDNIEHVEEPKASWVIVSPEIAEVLEPKLSLKDRYKLKVTQGKKFRKRKYDGI